MSKSIRSEFEDLVQAARQLQAKLISFPETERSGRLSISKDEAVQGFDQVTQVYELFQGMEQAGRCGECASPFCSQGKSKIEIGCPLRNDIPRWLEQVARGQIEDAIETAFKTNPAPDWTGVVCPQQDLCEGSCVLGQSGWKSVTIGAVEHMLGDLAWTYDLVPEIHPEKVRETSIGIIGSGPAAYAASVYLANLGHNVEIFERSDKPGGLLQYGIPNFKLSKDAVDRHYERLARAPNVTIHTKMSVGDPGTNGVDYRHVPFQRLVEHHDAVMIATGTYRPKNSRLIGNAESEDIPAIDFLETQNRVDNGLIMPGVGNARYLSAKDKRVVIMGGGDTMVDCVRTAIRQGARSVRILYYRGIDDIPATEKDFQRALEEGGSKVEILDFHKAIAMDGNARSGYKITAQKTRLTGETDKWGRPAIEDTGEYVTIDTEMLVTAVGFDPEDLPQLFGVPNMLLERNGTLKVEPIHRPSNFQHGAGVVGRAISGQFNSLVVAAGDIVRGPSLVVQSLRDGLDLGRFLHDAVRQPRRIRDKYRIENVFDLTNE